MASIDQTMADQGTHRLDTIRTTLSECDLLRGEEVLLYVPTCVFGSVISASVLFGWGIEELVLGVSFPATLVTYFFFGSFLVSSIAYLITVALTFLWVISVANRVGDER